jgi:uncharacterized protein (DUF2126 family)/transglutaminase-like putative cysteine protease
MSINIALSHCTTYRYDRPVSLGPHIVRLRPAPHCRTPILSYSLRVEPGRHFINWQQDPFSNYLARFLFFEPTDHLTAKVEIVAEMAVYNPFDFFLEPTAEFYPFNYEPDLAHDLAPYLKCESQGSSFEKFLAAIDRSKRSTVDFLVGLNVRIQKEIAYLVRMKPGVQSPEETLAKASGSCRDTAWLMCQLLRSCGIAARFVSGYLIQLRSDVASRGGSAGPEDDVTDLHAWTEAYLPGAGWIGFDPTSGLLAGEGHIPLACTPEPSSAAPITGSTGKCEVRFDVEMSLQRIYESPRVGKPYSEKEWQEILSVGDRVDGKLKEGDVRLTIGGEPTFVSADDVESAEWNTEALGPAKRKLAGDLIRRLRTRFAPGGLLHFGHGEWCRGEPLPRWVLGCYWRQDGLPVWTNFDLIAKEETDYQVTASDSALFSEEVSSCLGLSKGHVIPAHEDPGYYLWKERRLAKNNPPSEHLEDKVERSRLARILEQGLRKVVGHVLAIRFEHAAAGAAWVTAPSSVRPERLYLAPGDAPIGLRLPLDPLSWTSTSEYAWYYEPDSSPALPARQLQQGYLESQSEAMMRRGLVPQSRPDTPEEKADSDRGRPHEAFPKVVYAALAIEPRAGNLNVFMPPLSELENYLMVLGAVEKTAQCLGVPVLIGGYPPPVDSRLKFIKLAPENGVIAVTTHSASSWQETVEITTGVYEEARQNRLASEKFMLDGSHCGTGGGNHFLLGATTPTDSPFLRRPDLLRSLVSYWQNHPSLSYLFSGAFVGPDCQSPRVDEARNDTLHELEIAFNRIPEKGSVAPWLVDPIFRRVLVDVTGDPRHAEFCVAKLFFPNGGSERGGLLELRAFEMPPHERMSLVQQLLLRALIATFWEKPYRQPLVRWGTKLHDRFFLPHFVWQDFCDVVADLTAAGHSLRSDWFAPHFEFRFPLIGRADYRELRIEIRRAIEPWHIREEEKDTGGRVRYLDSSLERLQVKVSGLTGTRYQILCNGIPAPMQPTASGDYVVGIRYRARHPAHSPDPTARVHAPLVFDLYDSWNGKAVAGCTYHVCHPGGQNPTTFPINAYEAESRRLARFSSFGHTPGALQPPPVAEAREFPFTLDLRAYLAA